MNHFVYIKKFLNIVLEGKKSRLYIKSGSWQYIALKVVDVNSKTKSEKRNHVLVSVLEIKVIVWKFTYINVMDGNWERFLTLPLIRMSNNNYT